ncbi:MAG: hypothetical protein V7607_6186, partial [Solirubrobacteraceae bacterium]
MPDTGAGRPGRPPRGPCASAPGRPPRGLCASAPGLRDRGRGGRDLIAADRGAAPQPVAQVRDARALDDVRPLELDLRGDALEEQRARAEHDRDDVDLELVEHAGLDALAHGTRRGDRDVLLARRRAGLRDRRLEAVGHEVDRAVRRPVGGRLVREDVDRHAHRVLSAPAIGEVEVAAAADDRADAGERLAQELCARCGGAERRAGRDLGVTLEEPAREAADVVFRRGDAAVEGHGHVGDELGHPGASCGGRFACRRRSRPATRRTSARWPFRGGGWPIRQNQRVRQDNGQLARPLLVSAAPGMTFLADDDAVVAFPSAAEALAAARERPEARLALHAGAAHRDGGALAGPGVSRTRRLLELAHPGQTLLSAAVADRLPDATPLEDLGLHRLQDLSPPLRVFALRGERPSPPLRSLDATPNNLPTWPTSFVGRDTDLAELQDHLADTRLLTITGPGGSGKTRLAAQLAAEQAGRHPDGAWWIELGPLVDPAQVATSVAVALDLLVDAGSGTADALRAQLRDRRLLLCLDNCEHVLDAAAQVADALRDCPEVTIIATSREPLALAGETVWRLDPLAPAEARALFLERAAPLRPDLVLDAETDAAIPSMCRRLDGSPLALELAAAWMGTLTPRQIEAGLDDRFALLVRSPRDAVPRHASLLASMAWSHDLLDDTDRAVFRRLAVFTGSFDLAAAQDVCAGSDLDPVAVLGALGRLVDKSLVVAHDGRYRLAETIRQYAADRLRAAGERAATADHHLDHFLGRVRAAAPAREQDKDAWRAALAPEYDNLRAAIDHGLEATDPVRGRELAAELAWLWHLHRQGREGVGILHRAIARAPEDRSSLQAQLLAGVALVADTAGPLDVEVDAAERALALAAEHGDERLLALVTALSAVGRLYTDLDGAHETSLEADRLAMRCGERFVADAGRALRGMILHLRDRHDEASALLLGAADALAAHGDRGVASTALAFAAESARLTGDLEAARTLAERSIATAAPLHDHLRIGMGRSALALALGAAGDVGAGLAALDPLLPLVDDAAVFLPDVARALGTLQLLAVDAELEVRRLTAEAA